MTSKVVLRHALENLKGFDPYSQMYKRDQPFVLRISPMMLVISSVNGKTGEGTLQGAEDDTALFLISFSSIGPTDVCHQQR